MASDGFLQQPPQLGNQYQSDAFMASQLRRLIPNEVLHSIEQDLERFGWDVVTVVKEAGFRAEAEPPSLQKQDAWGERIDRVITSPAWQQQKAVAAVEGIVAIAYERQQGEYSRIYQAAKLVLYGASSGLFNCPLAMTDGAARVCELQRDRVPELEEALQHLTSRDPAQFWTSGQWMTEKAGGSDVAAATETVGVPEQAGQRGVGSWYRLTGYKWFTSAADGEMAFALARECDATEGAIPGNKGLTMFYVPISRDADGCPQGFEVVRLKDKLGTKQLPTAELRLRGMRALKVSEVGRGVQGIAAMVNITRVHNTAAAVSFMRRITALAQDYARRRRAFGALLIEQPLALRTLAWLEVQTCAATALLMEAARLLGLQETGSASSADASLLRLLTPLAKLFTAKQAVAVASEGLEFFGGVGYQEDSHVPVILRDSQVLPIWEGSTNVLALDLLRVLGGDPNAAGTFISSCSAKLASTAAAGAGSSPPLSGKTPKANSSGKQRGSRLGAGMQRELLARVCAAVEGAVKELEPSLQAAVAALRSAGRGQLPGGVQAGARDLAFSMTRVFAAVLLVEHAAWSGSPRHLLLAAQWCQEELGSSSSSSSSGNVSLGPRSSSHTVLGSGGQEMGGQGGAGGLGEAVLLAARVVVGVDEPLSQPRAKY